MIYEISVVGDINKCLNNRVLQNLCRRLEGKGDVKSYSRPEIKELYSNIINQLFDSSESINYLKKHIYIGVPHDKIKDEAQNEATIANSLKYVLRLLNNNKISEVEFFYSLIRDLTELVKLEGNLNNILDEFWGNKLLPENEFLVFKIFRTLLIIILRKAVHNVENTIRYNVKMNNKWNSYILVDKEMVDLLQFGSSSGLLSRIRSILSGANGLKNGSDVEFCEEYNIVKSTLVSELQNLSASRQIIFTRLLNHLAKLINDPRNYTLSNLLYTCEHRMNTLIWNVINQSIIESEMKIMYYDDFNLMKELEKMRVRGINVFRLFKILKYNNVPYLGDKNDYEKIKLEIFVQKRFEELRSDNTISKLGKSMYKNNMIAIVDSGILDL